MLDDEEKQRIEEGERFRRDLRAELDPPKKEESLWQAIFGGENVKWLATTILIPLVAFGTSYSLQHNNEHDLEGRADVNQLTALLPSLASTDQTQRCIALAVLREMGATAKKGTALKETYETISGDAFENLRSEDRGVKAKGVKAVGCLAPPGGQKSGDQPLPAATPVPPAAPAAAPRKDELVYLQIYHREQVQAAQALTSAIEAADIPVAPLDDVGADHGPGNIDYAQIGTIDIRYYYQDDLPLAVSLAKIVQQTTNEVPTLRDLSGRANKARKGVLEVWLPCAQVGAKCVIG